MKIWETIIPVFQTNVVLCFGTLQINKNNGTETGIRMNYIGIPLKQKPSKADISIRRTVVLGTDGS